MTEKCSGLQMFLLQYTGKLGIELYSHKQEYANHIGYANQKSTSPNQTKKHKSEPKKKSPLSRQNVKQYVSLSTLTGLKDGPRYVRTYTALWVITNGSAGSSEI